MSQRNPVFRTYSRHAAAAIAAFGHPFSHRVTPEGVLVEFDRTPAVERSLGVFFAARAEITKIFDAATSEEENANRDDAS